MIPLNISNIKQKFPFHHKITCHIQVVTIKLFIFWYHPILMKVNKWIVFTTDVIYWIKTQEHGGYVIVTTFRNPVGIWIVHMMNLSNEDIHKKKIYIMKG